MKNYTFLHNPRCSKSRQSLEIVETLSSDMNFEFNTVHYLDTPLTEDELKDLILKLKIKPLDLVRKKETIIKEESIDISNDEMALKAMAKYPKLMERPILVGASSAVIGRPPENMKTFLEENN